jgi:acetoin utilization protein AcuB
MYIEQIMTRHVDTVTEDMKLSQASHLMQQKGRRFMPVVDENNQLLGLLTRAEIIRAEPSAITTLSVGEVNYLMSKLRVANVMAKEVITCGPDTLVEQAGQKMRDKKISCLPVVDKGKLIGIITGVDIMDFLLDITGCNLVESTRIALNLSDERGTLGHLLDDITALGGYIATVVSPYSRDEQGNRTVILRFTADNPQIIEKALSEKGYQLITNSLPAEAPEPQTKETSGCTDEPGAQQIAEFMQQHDQFAKLLGIQMIDVKPGYAQTRMVVREDMLNSIDITHGGATFSLADYTFALASNSHGKVSVGLNAQINYTAPSNIGDILTATATENKISTRSGLYTIEIMRSDNTLIALFTGTVFRRNDHMQQWMK